MVEIDENIFKRGVLVQLTISCWTGQVRMGKDQYEVGEADKKLTSATKFLVDKESLKKLVHIQGEARRYLYLNSLPFPISGVMFVPKALLTQVDNKLLEIEKEYETAVEEFVSKYNEYRADAKERLKNLFDDTEYPADITSRFAFDWRYIVVQAPGESSLISPEMYQREVNKFKTAIDDFQIASVNLLRDKFREMVTHLVERMSDEKKVFKVSTITNLQEFIENFKSLNVSNDTELENLINKTKEIIGTVNPQRLRDDTIFRSDVADAMKEVQDNLEKVLVEQPTRRIVLEANESEGGVTNA